jgi:hypothetical protein
VWWHEAVASASDEHEAEGFDAENPLFILYTSGTTGKPKGILHTSGGYLTQAAFTHRNVFDLHPETDVYWCTADVGWITGHSYVVYGPLANGATQVMYEGTPDTPHPGRWWEIIEKYKVSIFYTAPTAIRSFMKLGREIPDGFDLSSIRVLGSVGEPINPEAWIWYHDVIGAGTAPIVDTWWQTETGAIMISALPGLTTLKPGSAQVPVPGIKIDILGEDGTRVDPPQGGLLVVSEPWPSMLRGIWGDPERFKETYWSKFSSPEAFKYFAGDGAHVDQDGDIWLLGRVDDVMNVSGHRLSTPDRGGGRGGGRCRRADRAGGGGVCHPAGRPGGCTDGGGGIHDAAGARRPADWCDRPPTPGVYRRGAAQDSLGQDHEATAAGRGGGPRGGRHHNARRHLRDADHQRQAQVAPSPPGGGSRSCCSCELRFSGASAATRGVARYGCD